MGGKLTDGKFRGNSNGKGICQNSRFIKVKDTTNGFFPSVNPPVTFAVKEVSSPLFPHLQKRRNPKWHPLPFFHHPLLHDLSPLPPLNLPNDVVLFSVTASRRQESDEGPSEHSYFDGGVVEPTVTTAPTTKVSVQKVGYYAVVFNVPPADGICGRQNLQGSNYYRSSSSVTSLTVSSSFSVAGSLVFVVRVPVHFVILH
ncbi:hypothetical protein PIB30_012951 [Stylosanthes scabra]|uniref:Uncharacterized protein n=1 Tax=Stylosanthes scabra TaxID=79078 RepID=A0ABU6Z5S6_9FABA|nr:hypothetical protein [Stylosanthes scabra]